MEALIWTEISGSRTGGPLDILLSPIQAWYFEDDGDGPFPRSREKRDDRRPWEKTPSGLLIFSGLNATAPPSFPLFLPGGKIVKMQHLLIIGVFLLSATGADAATWIVSRNGGGDFTQIQPAIDAATPGDQIIIRGSNGSYAGFTLEKPMQLHFESNARVNDHSYVRNIDGAVIIEGMEMLAGSRGIESQLIVNHVTDFQLTDFRADYSSEGTTNFGFLTILHLEDTSARLADIYLAGNNGRDRNGPFSPPTDGKTTMQAVNSSVILANPTLLPGNGGNSEPGSVDPAGYGGDGIRSSGSQILVMGSTSHRVTSGNGGVGDEGGYAGRPFAHFGPAANVIASVIQVIPGRHGSGGHGSPGPYVRDFTFPSLGITERLQIGGDFTWEVFSVLDGNLLLLLSDQIGTASLPGAGGAPWSVLPGNYFFHRILGPAEPGGFVSGSGPMANDPILIGLVVHAQVVLATADGALLSNPVSRTVGD